MSAEAVGDEVLDAVVRPSSRFRAQPTLRQSSLRSLERTEVLLEPGDAICAQGGRSVDVTQLRAEAGSGRQRIMPPSSSSGQAASQCRPQPGHCLSSSHSASSTTGHCITPSSSTRAHEGQSLQGQGGVASTPQFCPSGSAPSSRRFTSSVASRATSAPPGPARSRRKRMSGKCAITSSSAGSSPRRASPTTRVFPNR